MREMIKRWLMKLTCPHKWLVHKELTKCEKGALLPYRAWQILICRDCGKIKKLEL